ncbi:hypothetical protein L596_003961 [Steinernema carpocapsae]|uniref:LRRCT domain-containing protein n=1 Tax=Steinernema carpocapsae TaxID=34508 RepID=A0A4U8UUC9_STECR|nr:hypothetical protein L596_003961 [Steinernema carpocapsae]
MRLGPFFLLALLCYWGSACGEPEESVLVCHKDSAFNCTCTHEKQPTVVCNKARSKETGKPMKTANLKFPEDYQPQLVHLRHCDISEINQDELLCGNVKDLVELDLSDNRITYLGADAFKGMTSLMVLRLSHNQISKLHNNPFHDDLGMELHKLYLDYNTIEKLPDHIFEGLTKLKTLVLDGNSGIRITKELFKGLDSLEKLSLDYCDLQRLPPDVFSYLINLKELSLRGNTFDEVPAAVKSLQTLERLDMSNNYVVEINDRAFRSDSMLKELIMTDQRYMYMVGNCAFCDLKNLETVNLNNSIYLYSIHPNAFGATAKPDERPNNLTHLNLAYCKISKIDENLLKFDSLKSFFFEGNPLECDCLTDFLTEVKFSDTPRCVTPARLRNVKVKDATHMCGMDTKAMLESYFLVFWMCVLFTGVSLFFVKGHCINAFYKADMPHIGYSNLTARADDDQKQLQNDFDPVSV